MKNLYTKGILIFGTMVSSVSWAQDASPAPTSPTSVALIVALIAAIVVLVVISFMLYALGVLVSSMRDSGVLKDVPAIFKLTDAVPIDKEHEIQFDHEYDGIRELDNKLPPWWVAMFWVTVVFAFVYMWYYHFYNNGITSDDEYRVAMAEAEVQMKIAANKVNEENVTLLTDVARIEKGKEVFVANCASCHGQSGEGNIGPNLTDEYWIHGGDVKAVFKTIKYGITGKMQSWQSQLSPGQIQDVASFIKSIKGSNPPGGKEPQGELYQGE